MNPFHFKENNAEKPGPRRNLDLSEVFESLRARDGVGQGVVPRDPLGKTKKMVRFFPFTRFFRAFVRVKMPDLKLENAFSGAGKPEMSRLDDAGVDRSYGDLEDPFPLDALKNIISSDPGDLLTTVEILS